jgi:hypothetical protein
MALFFLDTDTDDLSDLRAEDAAQRRKAARLNHWCTECFGRTGPGSPCHVEPDDEPEDEDEDDGTTFCLGCNPEETVSEIESGKCASCGRKLA